MIVLEMVKHQMRENYQYLSSPSYLIFRYSLLLGSIAMFDYIDRVNERANVCRIILKRMQLRSANILPNICPALVERIFSKRSVYHSMIWKRLHENPSKYETISAFPVTSNFVCIVVLCCKHNCIASRAHRRREDIFLRFLVEHPSKITCAPSCVFRFH